MLIGDNWKIESDELNVILYKKYIHKKTSEEYWRACNFYSSVANALAGLIDLEIQGTGLKDLETVNQKIEELKSLILANC